MKANKTCWFKTMLNKIKNFFVGIVGKTKNVNINYKKNYWIFFTAPLVLILAGIIVFACCSFNFTFSFSGGKILSIDYAVTMTDAEYAAHESKVNEIIQDAGITKYTVEKLGEDGDYTTMVKIVTTSHIQVSESTIDGIIDQITDEYGADSLGFEITSTTSQPFAGNRVITSFIIVFVVMLAAYVVYIGFRYNFASAFASIIGLLFAITMTCAFTIITRIPTDEYFIAILLGISVYMVFLSIFKFGRAEEHLIYDENKNLSNSDLMNIVRRDTFKLNSILNLTLFAAIIIFLIFGANQIRFIMLQLLVGLVSCVYVNEVILASTWVQIYNRQKDRRLREKQETDEQNNTK